MKEKSRLRYWDKVLENMAAEDQKPIQQRNYTQAMNYATYQIAEEDEAAKVVSQSYRPEAVETQESGDFEKAAHGDMLTSTPLYDPNDKQRVVAYEMTFKGVPGKQQFAVGDPRVQGGRMEKYTVDGVSRLAGSESPIVPENTEKTP